MSRQPIYFPQSPEELPSPSSGDEKPKSKGLSTGAKIGIGIVVAVVAIVILGLIAWGIWYLVTRSNKKYQIPANTPNVKTTLANITPTSTSNGPYYSKNGTCTLATDANAIGWQITNNSGVTLNNNIYYVGNGSSNCNGVLGSNNAILTNSTVNWYDISGSNGTYFTYYPGCVVAIVTNNQTQTITKNIPANINPANQYIQITVTSSSNNVIQATSQVITI